MNRKFKYKHSKSFIIISLLLLIILLINLIVNILHIVDYVGAVSISLDIASIITSIIIGTLILLLLFNTHYKINEKKFSFTIGCVWSKKPLDDILLLREDRKNGLMLMYFKRTIKGEDKIDYLSIQINPLNFDSFASAVREGNNKAQYELFSKENNTDGYSNRKQ